MSTLSSPAGAFLISQSKLERSGERCKRARQRDNVRRQPRSRANWTDKQPGRRDQRARRSWDRPSCRLPEAVVSHDKTFPAFLAQPHPEAAVSRVGSSSAHDLQSRRERRNGPSARSAPRPVDGPDIKAGEQGL
jgi:hypothetical protein